MLPSCFLGSSRKNRRVPFYPAFRGERTESVENGLWPPEFRSHNMGLCDMNAEGGGGGGFHFVFCRGAAR